MTCLEHLDERDRQVQISNVAADQTQAEHDADGDDSAPGEDRTWSAQTALCALFGHFAGQPIDGNLATTHMYVWGVMGTLWRESSMVVNLAMNWVIHVEKNMCHVVRKRARTGC